MTENGKRPMIENSDRGLTINKSLAWTMLVALVGLVWYGGSTITGLENATSSLTLALADTKILIAAERQAATSLESRVRTLENSATRQDARFDALSRSLEELKAESRQTNDLLRRLVPLQP